MKMILKFLLFSLLSFNFGCLLDENEKIIQDVKSTNLVVRNNAIYHLGKKKEKRALPVLIELLQKRVERDGTILAIEALGKIGEKSSVNVLVGFLGAKDNHTKIAAIEALGKIKDPRAVMPLVNLLNDPDGRLTVIWALGNIGDKRAVPPIRKLLKSQDKYVVYGAAQALKNIAAGR